MVTLPVYLDCHATTPVDPRVVDAMLPYFTEHFGNAASRTHRFGWAAAEAVDRARRQVAALIGASPKEIVFTSGATESNNLALKGVAEALRSRGDHIVTVATEHHAVLDPCGRLERDGFRVTRLGVSADGLIDPDDVARAIDDRTILVTVMAANNEIGILQPLVGIGAIARARGILFHTDAAQAVGRVPFDVTAAGVDLASFTAHKMYGPKGVGALYVRRRSHRLVPLIDGGGQEGGLRSGTLNVPGIVGFGAAAEACAGELTVEPDRVGRLRDRLRDGLLAGLPGLRINGSRDRRLPHNLHVSVEGVDGEALMTAIEDLAVSSGAACASAGREPSHVLAAIGLDPDLARASLRFGLGRFTTMEEIDYAVGRVMGVVTRLREMTPVAASSTHARKPGSAVDPRIGTLSQDDPDVGSARVSDETCGDSIRFQIRVDPSRGVIEASRFRSFGCRAAAASAGLAARWVEGRPLDEIRSISGDALAAELGLTPSARHASALAADAVRAAVADYLARREVR